MTLSAAEFRARQDDWRTALCIYRKPNGRRFTSAEISTALALQYYERATGPSQGTAYPSQLTIAKRAGFTGKTTSMKTEAGKALDELLKAGFIKKLFEGEKGDSVSPSGRPATWKLTLPKESVREIEGLFPPKDKTHNGVPGMDESEPGAQGVKEPGHVDDAGEVNPDIGTNTERADNQDPTGNGTLHPTGNAPSWGTGNAPSWGQGYAPYTTTSDSTLDSTSEINPSGSNGLEPDQSPFNDLPDDAPAWMHSVKKRLDKQKDNRLTAGHGQEANDYVPGQVMQDWTETKEIEQCEF